MFSFSKRRSSLSAKICFRGYAIACGGTLWRYTHENEAIDIFLELWEPSGVKFSFNDLATISESQCTAQLPLCEGPVKNVLREPELNENQSGSRKIPISSTGALTKVSPGCVKAMFIAENGSKVYGLPCDCALWSLIWSRTFSSSLDHRHISIHQSRSSKKCD